MLKLDFLRKMSLLTLVCK